jgi:predicted phosphodiesterase
MRLLILSDLHIELWRDGGPQIDLAMARPDVVILAGDIHSGTKGVAWAMKTFADIPTLYVPGNHEAYGSALDKEEKNILDACNASGHVHYLNPAKMVIGDVRFLGATLWTDFRLFGDDARPAAMQDAESSMNDYQLIRLANQKYRKLRASDTAQLHAGHKSWLQKELAEPFVGKTVVITHMAPSMHSVSPQFASDPVTAAFASALDELVSQADVWVHGHMHDSFDYQIGKCRVVCNPRGYRKTTGATENQHFDPNLVVDLID